MEGLAVPFPHLLPLPPVPKLVTVSAPISTSTSTPTGNYLLTYYLLFIQITFLIHSSYLPTYFLLYRRRRRRRIHLSQTTASTTSFSLLYIIIIALPA
jgi:hypothetical protein